MAVDKPDKTERMVNLTILLLSSRRYVSKEQIRQTVQGYQGLSDDAFERKFERDKDDLRSLGVPIEVGTTDILFDDEQGYRIARRDFELPPIEFTPDEATVLGLAATVWQQASAAEGTAHALAKLRAAGVELDTARLTALEPQISAREDAFDPLWQAFVARRVVRFEYRGDQERTVEGWRLAWRNNSWYLLGYDRGRQAPRLFKLSRITSAPRALGKPDAYAVPGEEEIDEQLRDRITPESDLETVVAIRGERAPALRRRGAACAAPLELPTGFEAYQVTLNSNGAVAEIASYGPDVIVLEPVWLRSRVLEHLRQVVSG